MRQALFAVLAFGLAAHQAAVADPPKPKPEKPPAERFERDMLVRFHMHENFDLVRAIEKLLVRGKLDEAKLLAESIAMAPDEPEHGPWVAQTIVVRDRALALARATSVNDALRKETRLAAACGDCHRESSGSAVFGDPPPIPPDRPTIDARMARHRWASERLWEAIVGDVDEAWGQGLDVLAATPLDVGTERASLARDLQKIATTARRAKGPVQNRPATYGEILVVCASCHAKR